MTTVEQAYTAWTDYQMNAPLADVFTDTFHTTLMGLWMAYVEALGGKDAVKAYTDLVTLKTPQITPITEIDPQSPQRLTGVLRWKTGFGYITVKGHSQDYKASPTRICGNVSLVPGTSYPVTFDEGADAISGFLNARRIVILGNAASEAAYEKIISTPKKAAPAKRETLYMREKRLAAEAEQRRAARANAHQVQDVRIVTHGEVGYEIDELGAYNDMDIPF